MYGRSADIEMQYDVFQFFGLATTKDDPDGPAELAARCEQASSSLDAMTLELL